MKEYYIEVGFTVDARDDDEAAEIAKHVCALVSGDPLANAGQQYKVRDVETNIMKEIK